MKNLIVRGQGVLNGKSRWFLLLAGMGILLMLLGARVGEEPAPPEPTQESPPVFDLEEFQGTVQEKLSLIDGAGRVEVLLSLESGTESVYASDVRQDEQTDRQENGSASRTYESALSVVSDSSYGQTPVLIKTVYPEFRGAVVICDGADSSQVRYAVTQAVESLCGISSDKISIMKMQGGNASESH